MRLEISSWLDLVCITYNAYSHFKFLLPKTCSQIYKLVFCYEQGYTHPRTKLPERGEVDAN